MPANKRRPHKSALAAPGTSQTTTIFEHECDPFIVHSEDMVTKDGQLAAGQYEWPFEIFLPGSTPETTKGCSRCSIAYYIKASTIRGNSESHPQAYRAIRIIRTLPTSAVDMMDASTVEGTWPRPLRYSASISHKAIALGTSIPFDLDLTVLDRKTRVASVRCQLVEIHRLEHPDVPGYQVYAGSREVCGWDLLDGSDKRTDSVNAADCSRVHIVDALPLPSSPAKCSPDVDVRGIQVRHALHFDIELKGPGEERSSVRETRLFTFKSLTRSQHRATLPLLLFVSRALPINGSGSFVAAEAVSPVETCTGVPVPPTYGDHLRDHAVGDEEGPPAGELPAYGVASQTSER